MKTVAMRLEDTTIEILEAKAKEQRITVSEYLRQQIFPLMEGTKPLTLEQSLAKLERSLLLLHVCVKPLQELVFELQKFEAELIIKYQNAPFAEKEPEIEKIPIEEEKKTDG
jgi:hypothetical protein